MSQVFYHFVASSVRRISSTSLFHLLRAKDGSRTRNLQLGRLELYQLSYFRLVILLCNHHSYSVGTGGFEPPKSKQQIYSLSHLATLVYPLSQKKSRRRDSNPRPTDYKSVALPAELLRLFCFFKELPLKREGKCSNTF